MGIKASYLPIKYWFENETLHRAYFEYEEYCDESPREWDNMTIIVNASKYNLCGSNDIQTDTNRIDEWLVEATGINPVWYENHGNYGMKNLVAKFIKEKCIAFSNLSVYEHSGISVSCGTSYGWDYSNVGFVYIPKDNKEVKAYRKTHTLAETQKWAANVLRSEINVLDDYMQGFVFCIVHETFDTDSKEWDVTNSLGDIYLTSNTREKVLNIALSYIKEYSGDNKFFEEEEVEKAIKENTLDILNGQTAFEFMEATA